MLNIKRLNIHAIVPNRGTIDSAGLDLYSVNEEAVYIGPGDRILFPVGWSMSVPSGYEIQIRPRSGLALKEGITVLNTPGTIDSDFRNEVGVILINTSKNIVIIQPGTKIAQMIINEIKMWEPQIVEELPETSRKGGFGSTGR